MYQRSLPLIIQNHQADNLLNLDTYRKWKCASAGEKKAAVVLQVGKTWYFDDHLPYYSSLHDVCMGEHVEVAGRNGMLFLLLCDSVLDFVLL